MPIESATVNEKFSLKNGGYSDARNSGSLPRHRWYFVKEAFAPSLVEKAMDHADCREGDVVVDPFCGSGTVPLVATLRRCQSIGFEANPFLAFLSKAKMLQAQPDAVAEGSLVVTDAASTANAPFLNEFSTFSHGDGLTKWLFNQQVLTAFKGGWDATLALDASIRDLLQVALLGAAMDTCNATRDGKALRYRKTWHDINFDAQDFQLAFTKRVENIRLDLADCPVDSQFGAVRYGDSRNQLATLARKFRLCVTSPPYLNSFDYTDVYRPELFLGGFVSSQQELRSLRQDTIRSHVQANWREPIKDNFGPRYAHCAELVQQRSAVLWDKRIPKMIQAYFEDLQGVLSQLFPVAEKGASLWLVVSTSAYAGVEIPVDLILADIAVDIGWRLEEIGLLRYMRTSSQHWKKWEGLKDRKPCLRETVVVLKA